jgi:type IV pilus assembly protein PilC
MPKYFFIAKSLEGVPLTGIREIKDKIELAKILRQEGYFLVSAVIKEENKKKQLELNLSFFNKVSLTDKMMFVRNLRVMIGAGLSLNRALEILILQSKNKKLKEILSEIREGVIKGQNFSECLAKYPNIFSEVFQNMIKVGEETGSLEQSLEVLAQQIEKDYKLRSKIKGALMYPIVIICAMIAIGALMLIMVVPGLARTFEGLGIELPITTKFIITISTFLAEKWYLIILIIIALFVFLRIIFKTKTGKRVIDAFLLRLPIISSLIKKINSTYTLRTLSSLISSGVPIVRSLEIVSGVLGNIYYKTAILKTAEEIKKGKKLSDALMPYQDIYPLIIFQMMKVGEETGETSKILAKLADFFEEEMDNTTKNLSTILEPVLMLIVGAAVGFFVIAMFQPMIQLMRAL